MKLLERSRPVLAALLIVAALASFLITGASAASFTDVSSSAWYASAVNFVTARGLFQGTSDTKFSPNGVMTRAMFITVLGRYAHVDPDTWLAGQVTGSGVNMRSGPGTSYGVVTVLSRGATVTLAGKSGSWYKVKRGSQTGYVSAQYISPRYHSFNDVSYGQYYAGYAVWAYEKGVAEGLSDKVFSPNGNVTRQQACTFLDRFATVMGLKVSQKAAAVTFKDSTKISSWAKTSVTAMQRAGVVEGDEKGYFNPGGSATRAQAAAMLMRFDSACGGSNTPSTMPPAPTLRPTPTPANRPIPTPAPSKAPVPGYPADTPATFVSGTVKPRFTVVRVGLYVSTNTYNTCLAQVPLYNVNGTGFEYGIMGTDRQFYGAGTISDRSITVTVSGNVFTIRDSGGKVVHSVTTSALAIHPTGGAKGLTKVNNSYSYNGDFELRPAANAPGKITVINFVGIEDYVKGVLPWEFGFTWPAETMKAAAVASRSHIQKTDLVYLSFGIDVVANDGTQAYQGRRTYGESSFAATDAAVDATEGQYLTYNGEICLCSFSACDGGQILSAQQVFGTNYPYLVAKEDPYETYVKNEISNYNSLVRASHRVGLSQWGAYSMGKYFNKNYTDILGFYYTGTHLQFGV